MSSKVHMNRLPHHKQSPSWKHGTVCAAAVVAFISVVLLSASGCSGRPKTPKPPMMTLNIMPEASANGGQVFYMLVRSTNQKQFLTDGYQTIASLVFTDPADPSVLGVFPVFPDRQQKVKVVQPDQNPVAFYFLFTNPSEQWRQLAPQPLGVQYDIYIEKETVTLTPRKGWPRRLWPF